MTDPNQISLWKDCLSAAKALGIVVDVGFAKDGIGTVLTITKPGRDAKSVYSVEEMWGLLSGIAFDRDVPLVTWFDEKESHD